MEFTPISDLQQLLASMSPVLNDGIYAYVMVASDTDLRGLDYVGSMKEAEGLTLIVPEATAAERGWSVLFRCQWITLHVHSDLAAVGLTAAFASALGAAQLSCNVVAGACHDHIFVPAGRGEEAVQVLRELQQGSMPSQ
ncbi:acetyltransferase [Pokkaliibacter plantistimulans]|uniref:Acetyltransferase n=1 Tax=Proteobacteria bacterium 228 TaxID=2083153 RepID=A0A2S5KX59_9PROT|nr:ACT domain-containing protein [Pokkaliibacter plantistimulans]PPC79222.1 acetyltransferase [Pokkaliibacter plantistimulans]